MRRTPRQLLTAAAACAVAALAAPIAQAAAATTPVPCQTRTTTQAFQAWGDSAPYFAAPNGTFESGSSYWTLASGAYISEAQEPWNVFGAGESSLGLPAGSSGASIQFCVTSGEQSVRMFVRRPGQAGASLHVEVRATQPATGQQATTSLDIDGAASGWTPTSILTVPALFGTSSTENISVYLQPTGASASWRVDDIAVDPYRCC